MKSKTKDTPKTSPGQIPVEFSVPAQRAIKKINSNAQLKKIGYRLNQTQLLRLLASCIDTVIEDSIRQSLTKTKRKRKPKAAPVVEVVGSETNA
jgi:hypothetical protein